MLNLLLETSAETTGKTTNGAGSWWIYVVLLVLIVLMLVLPTITNRKRMKEYDQMVNQLHVGDTIRTVGGVIGRITKISDKDGVKTFILETGAKNNKTTMEFDIGSVGTVLKSTAKSEEKVEKVEETKKAEEQKAEEQKAEEQKAEQPEEVSEPVENAETAEAKDAEKVEEAAKPAKKAKSKKK